MMYQFLKLLIIVKEWVKILQEAEGKDIVTVIAGNKFDLSNKEELNKRN